MVICLIGILSVVAIPRYYNVIARGYVAAEQGVVGGVRAGIYTYMANKISDCTDASCANPYPATLDAVAIGTLCSELTPCFVTVLAQGGVTSQWKKATNTVRYKNLHSGNTYSYDAATGNFARV